MENKFIRDEKTLDEIVPSLKATYNTLSGGEKAILRSPRDVLMDIRGIGEGTALEILAAIGRLFDEPR